MPSTRDAHRPNPCVGRLLGEKLLTAFCGLGHTARPDAGPQRSDPGELEESHGGQSECFPGRGSRSHRGRSGRRSQRGAGGAFGGGKTTLVEALLVAAGVLNRPGSVADGTTVCDYDDAEIRQQRSVGVAVASLSHDGIKVNLVDTPGYADFVGELRAGLRAADCALFVIAANEGVDEPTKSLWQECSQVGMPRAVVITKLDHARANYPEALAAAQNAFGDKVLPLYLPTGLPSCERPDRIVVADPLQVRRRQADRRNRRTRRTPIGSRRRAAP